MAYANVILMILKAIYPTMRPILKKAVNDPDQDWDDVLMSVLDKILGYEEKPK